VLLLLLLLLLTLTILVYSAELLTDFSYTHFTVSYRDALDRLRVHNLPLLPQLLSSQLSLLRSSTVLSIKEDFVQLRMQINQTTTKFQAYFKHVTRLKCSKQHQSFVDKTETKITEFTRLCSIK